MPDPVQIVVLAGNDSMCDRHWSEFIQAIDGDLGQFGTALGKWASDPFGPNQKALWYMEFESAERAAAVRALVASTATTYQDTVGWCELPEVQVA